MISRFIAIIQKIVGRLYISTNVKKYVLELKRQNLKNNNLVLFDYIASYPVYITFYHIINAMKNNVCNLNFVYINNSRIQKLDRIGIPNRIFNYLYHLHMEQLVIPLYSSLNIKDIENILNNIKSKEDIVNYTIDGLVVGDLIYDTYLKWEKVPTIDFNNKDLLRKYFIQTYDLYSQAEVIYETYPNLQYFFAGDIAYIYSGVLARYLTDKDITVINFIESTGLEFNFLKKPYYFRRKKYWEYPEKFSLYTLEKRKKAILLAETALYTKLIDAKINYVYMNNNSFSKDYDGRFNNTLEKIKQLPFKVFIPLHCFMDSPHIYRWMVYPDFYEWITDTLASLEKQGIQCIIKPHPNGFPENDAIVDKLTSIFPNHFFIDKSISNQILIDMDIDVVLSVYGSVGYEFSYFNIPVVCAGDNPHVAYDFTITCKNREEYCNYLLEIQNISHSINKEKILEFYYMHYIENDAINGINPVYPIDEFLNVIDKNASSQQQREAYHHNQDILKIECEKINKADYTSIEQQISNLLIGKIS